MAENSSIEGELRQCNVFFVTYYWTQPAVGVHFYTNVALIVISISTVLFGIIANVLIIISYLKNYRLRTLSNIPLLSLAFADLLVTSVVKPLHVTRLIMEIYGKHDCNLWSLKRLSSYFSSGVSLLSVTVISVERFITLAYPLRYRIYLTKTRMNTAIAVIWIVTFVLVMTYTGLIPYTVLRAIGTSTVILCTSTLLVIWIWVYKLLRNHKKRITTDHRPSCSSKYETRQQIFKNTRTSGVIVTGLVVSYLPLVLMLGYYWLEQKSFTGIYLVTPWGETFVLAHSLFNPLYVFWRKREFRQTVRNIILGPSTIHTQNLKRETLK